MAEFEQLRQQLAEERTRNELLEVALNEERALRTKAEKSLAELRKLHGALAANCEVEEERLVNKLIGKITEAKVDKERLALELECEEELLTNNLQRQLESVREEKEQVVAEVVHLKNELDSIKNKQEKVAQQVEVEEEHLSNTLFKKLRNVMTEKVMLEGQISRSRSSSVCGTPGHDSPSSRSTSRNNSVTAHSPGMNHFNHTGGVETFRLNLSST